MATRRSPAVAGRSAFAAAAASALTTNTARVETMSAIPVIADASAPATKPTWTATVSRATAAAVKCHSRASDGATAAALNHVLIAPICATAINARAAHRPCGAAGSGMGRRDDDHPLPRPREHARTPIRGADLKSGRDHGVEGPPVGARRPGADRASAASPGRGRRRGKVLPREPDGLRGLHDRPPGILGDFDAPG